jgi:PAS domain S-box-containing protein
MSGRRATLKRSSLIDHDTAVPMWYSETDSGLIVDANDAALRFWGYKREAFIGMPAIRLLSPEELAKQRKLSKLHVAGQTGPWKCQRADGSVVYTVVRWKRVRREHRSLDVVALHSAGEEPSSLERPTDPKPARARSRQPASPFAKFFQ